MDRYFAIIPAAGCGKRFAADLPKQYARVGDKTLLEWSLRWFLMADWITTVVVVLAAEDRHFHNMQVAQHPKIRTALGGCERQDSVISGLNALQADAEQSDFILVHDAARPNLQLRDLLRLRDELTLHPTGGLLGAPIVDSLKRVVAGNVIDSVSREQLYRALTPQMFRYGVLNEALKQNQNLSDEATAMQLAGKSVQMVNGRSDNFKVTVAEDLELIRALLEE